MVGATPPRYPLSSPSGSTEAQGEHSTFLPQALATGTGKWQLWSHAPIPSHTYSHLHLLLRSSEQGKGLCLHRRRREASPQLGRAPHSPPTVQISHGVLHSWGGLLLAHQRAHAMMAIIISTAAATPRMLGSNSDDQGLSWERALL